MTASQHPSADELEAGALDVTDARIFTQLAGLYTALDPVPTGLVERIQFGITLDALHAELAELERSDDLVGVRSEGATEVQTVTFTSANLTIMITVTVVSAERVRIDGWAAPGGGVSVDLRSVDGVITETADTDGRFAFVDAPRGLAQFVVRQPGAGPHPPVITPSIEI
jgi:hypothetical protein